MTTRDDLLDEALTMILEANVGDLDGSLVPETLVAYDHDDLARLAGKLVLLGSWAIDTDGPQQLAHTVEAVQRTLERDA